MSIKPLKKNMDLVNGPIFRTLLFFAFPTLLANVLQSLNGSINSIWVGRFLGEEALAATGNATVVLFLLFSLIFGFGMAAMVFIGRAYGHNDIRQAREFFGAALTLSLILSIIFMFLGIAFSDNILRILYTSPDIFSMSHSYLKMIFIAMPGIVLLMITMTILRGTGDSLTPLWFMIINVSLDVLLNPVFILGLGPFKAMGITGSAFSTVIASYSSLILLFLYIYARKLSICLRGPDLYYFFPRLKIIRQLFFQGLAMAMQMIVISVSSVIFIGRVNQEGVETLAVFNVMQQVWSYLQMPAMAIGAAVSAMVAQNIGADSWRRVFKITNIGMALAIGMTIFLLSFMVIFNESLMHLFLVGDFSAVKIAGHIQFVAGWSYIFIAIQMILNGALRANQAVIFPLIASIIAFFPVRSFIYHFFYPSLHADAIWYGFAATNVLSCLLVWIYYKMPYWRKIKKRS